MYPSLTTTRRVTERVSDLDAFGVRSLSLSVRTGLQGLVEMVDGLTGGVLDRQQAVFSHPAAIEGLHLLVCGVHLRESLDERQF